jgi:nucleoside-diphosphate-sugar epimerase
MRGDVNDPRDGIVSDERPAPANRELTGLRALVLGGTGLIGSHVVRSLLSRGCGVRVLSRGGAAPAPALRGLPVEKACGDLAEPDSIRDALRGVDLLFHAAAPYPTRHLGMDAMVRRAVSETEAFLRVCREAVPPDLLRYRPRHSDQAALEQAEMAAHVARVQPERVEEIRRAVRDAHLLALAEEGRLNASLHPSLAECRDLPGLKRVVYTSSVTTIGRPRGSEPGRPLRGLADESDRYDLPVHPSPYFACKHLMEGAVARAANEGLPAVIVNPTLVVDAGDAHLTTGRLLLEVARRRMPFYLPGHVDGIAGTDVGEGHVLAATRGRTGHRYILGHERTSLREFLAMVADEAGVPPPWIPCPLPLAEALSLSTEALAFLQGRRWPLFPTHGLRMLRCTPPVDSSLAVRELGMPQTPVRDAVRRALAWYREEELLS